VLDLKNTRQSMFNTFPRFFQIRLDIDSNLKVLIKLDYNEGEAFSASPSVPLHPPPSFILHPHVTLPRNYADVEACFDTKSQPAKNKKKAYKAHFGRVLRYKARDLEFKPKRWLEPQKKRAEYEEPKNHWFHDVACIHGSPHFTTTAKRKMLPSIRHARPNLWPLVIEPPACIIS